MKFGRGWRPNQVPFEHTFSGARRAGTQPAHSDLTPFCAPVMDQGQTSSCTGHASSDGIYTSYGIAGRKLAGVPSPRLLYIGGRSEERSRLGIATSVPLSDEGANPSDVMRFVAQIGFSTMGPQQEGRYSDVSLSNVNNELDLGSIESSHKAQSHAISKGANTIGDLCAALVAYACPAGFFVDTAFENWDLARDGFVGAPRNPNDPDGGGHYIDLVGFASAGLLAQQPKLYLPQRIVGLMNDELISVVARCAAKLPSTDPVFFGKNSWAGGWGLFGYFLATKEWLNAPQTGDINAIVPV